MRERPRERPRDRHAGAKNTENLKQTKIKLYMETIISAVAATNLTHKMTDNMRVIKRSGATEELLFDKILNRIRKLGVEVGLHVNYQSIVIKVADQLRDMISTSEIDELTAQHCAVLSTTHPDYGVLAGRIAVSNYQKNTRPSFTETMRDIQVASRGLLLASFMEFVEQHAAKLDAMIQHENDYLIDYFGFKTLETSYLLKCGKKPVERPQHMWLRVAVGIHAPAAAGSAGAPEQELETLKKIKNTYKLMSNKYFTHATPTLYNAGTINCQLSSCFLLAMEDDSIEGIYNTLSDCAKISKVSGGIGLHIHNIRSEGSRIRGTNGETDGIVPMLRVFNESARYVNQSGKRNGSFAIYLEPWHADIEKFLELRKNQGDEKLKARDLFYALWVPDLFMERVQDGGTWSLFCPDECRGLADVCGDAFAALYTSYESSGKARKVLPARDLWMRILDAQMETGVPYMLYKDAANLKSNQKNLGTIKSSNLCCEIMQYSDPKETAVCNLASIALPAFVTDSGTFDFDKLHQITKTVTENLNKIIDINHYPTEKTRISNMRHRPIGIGVQGLADTFILLGMPFTSDAARALNREIFETMYHGALEASHELAVAQGSYESFAGSPASQGILQFDMWGVVPASGANGTSGRYNWGALKEKICRDGLRNSLLLAPMPTASTSQILGYNECIEPFTSNIYSRKTLAGTFVVINKYLIRELIQMGKWSEDVKNDIIRNNGSIQFMTWLPAEFREKYKIAWEMPMRTILDMSAERGAYICQSQSLNLWVEQPNSAVMSKIHFHAWKLGLKTGMYYLRTKAVARAAKFTVTPATSASAASSSASTASTSTDTDLSLTEEDKPCETCSA